MTREKLRTLAFAEAEIWIDVPRRVPSVDVGFGDDSGMNYAALKSDRRAKCIVPLAHFLDHAQIDGRLFRDAVLGARCAGSATDLIGVAADPPPRIVEFSAEPGRISRGGTVVAQWAVENCEGVVVSIAPGIGPVDAEGSCEIRVQSPTVVTLTLSAPGMQDVDEERVIEVEDAKPASTERRVPRAKTRGRWRLAKGFSPGELAAVPGAAGLEARVDSRRRSVHAVNVASLERWMN